MAAGDNIRNGSIQIIDQGGQPTWIPGATTGPQFAKELSTSSFWYYDFTNTTWINIDLDFNDVYTGEIISDNQTSLKAILQELEAAIVATQATIQNDGNHTFVVSANAIEDVEPTTTQVPSPEEGDTAAKSLSSQKIEHWSYDGTAWTKAFTVDYSDVNIPVETVSDTDTIALVLDGVTGDLTANLKIDSTQDGAYQITQTSNGIRVTRQTLQEFDTEAAAIAALGSGAAYCLTINNLENVTTMGLRGPVFYTP